MTMQPFTTLSSVAAPLPEENIDTDIIFPARFLLLTAREGLGEHAFADRKLDRAGNEVADFVLNRAPWRDAQIIVAGANFGTGSSREQAVWALLGRGVRCVIAPSFGEIFFGNCFRNGVLPVKLDAEVVAQLLQAAETAEPFTVDLPSQTITAGALSFAFQIDEERKQALLNGWDETAQLLNANADAITAFETRQRAQQSWLYEALS